MVLLVGAVMVGLCGITYCILEGPYTARRSAMANGNAARVLLSWGCARAICFFVHEGERHRRFIRQSTTRLHTSMHTS